MLYGLDLFSGIGGISLALEQWVRPVAYCENDRYAQGVLLSRMADGSLPVAPIWDDVRTLRASHLPRGIEIIYGGFPCQDISVAGHGIGITGERSGLVSEIWRLADELRPQYIFLENVPAIVANGLDSVLAALAKRGFDAQWLCLSAAEVGACHERNRWWLLAHANDQRQLQPQGVITNQCGWPDNGTTQDVRSIGWPTIPAFCGTDARISDGVDRLKCLGNSVVPQCAEEAFRRLIQGV